MYPMRTSLRFALLWALNAALITALFFLLDWQIPAWLSYSQFGGVLGGIALLLAVLEQALIGKLKGE